MAKKQKHSLIKREDTQTEIEKQLEARIVGLENSLQFEISQLRRQVVTLSQALRMSHDRTSHVIEEFGLDVPERLRPRR